MKTRFALETDKERGWAYFNFLDTLELNPGTYAQNTGWGMVHRTLDSGGANTYTIGSWISKLDSSDNSIVDVDALTLAGTKNATFRYFRNTNTSGTRQIIIYKGDGTNTPTITFNAGTGSQAQIGDMEVTDATKGIVLKSPNGTRYRITVADNGTLTATAL